MIKLLKFELRKVWINNRSSILAFIGIQVVLILLIRLLFWDDGLKNALLADGIFAVGFGAKIVIACMLYYLSAFLLPIGSFIECVYRFDRDLGGKNAVFELMLPIKSVKFVLAKLIASTAAFLTFTLLSVVSLVAFYMVNTKFDSKVTDGINMFLTATLGSPLKAIFTMFIILFAVLSLMILAYFCVALSKTITHKLVVAVSISIMTFTTALGFIGYLAIKLVKYPVISYSVFGIESSLGSDLFSFAVFGILFYATSWLIEKKIEL